MVANGNEPVLTRFNSSLNLCCCFFKPIFFTDIDECETEEANCAHGCHNTLGSYACVCNTAYELGSDGKQCYSPLKSLILILLHEET